MTQKKSAPRSRADIPILVMWRITLFGAVDLFSTVLQGTVEVTARLSRSVVIRPIRAPPNHDAPVRHFAQITLSGGGNGQNHENNHAFWRLDFSQSSRSSPTALARAPDPRRPLLPAVTMLARRSSLTVARDCHARLPPLFSSPPSTPPHTGLLAAATNPHHTPPAISPGRGPKPKMRHLCKNTQICVRLVEDSGDLDTIEGVDTTVLSLGPEKANFTFYIFVTFPLLAHTRSRLLTLSCARLRLLALSRAVARFLSAAFPRASPLSRAL
ncbi:hypothetical protein EDB85DRAFT_2156491 [Lactarius pseudohatsudake]|nr:hypothetical protein EDB85DRAFT_2156491 [Lactarius pseudohatsudake]